MDLVSTAPHRSATPESVSALHDRSITGRFQHELEDLLHACGICRPRPGSWAVCAADDSNRGAPDLKPATSSRLGRVVTYIDEHLDAPLTLDRLAEEAELSKFHFSRVFRRETGDSPWSFVRRARVERAKTLLERGESPAAAAVEAGFYDQSHLTRVMKEVEGTTPGRFREESRRGERKIVQD